MMGRIWGYEALANQSISLPAYKLKACWWAHDDSLYLYLVSTTTNEWTEWLILGFREPDCLNSSSLTLTQSFTNSNNELMAYKLKARWWAHDDSVYLYLVSTTFLLKPNNNNVCNTIRYWSLKRIFFVCFFFFFFYKHLTKQTGKKQVSNTVSLTIKTW